MWINLIKFRNISLVSRTIVFAVYCINTVGTLPDTPGVILSVQSGEILTALSVYCNAYSAIVGVIQ